jgi:uncharacterized membrane protein
MTPFGMTGRNTSGTKGSQSLQHGECEAHDRNVGALERWGSVIGGATLVAYGLKRRSLGGAALALLGGGLAYRGMTGYCQLYQALGRNTAKDAMATSGIEVERAITIAKAPEELYQFWHHVENLPRFMAHIKSVQSTGHLRSHWVARAPLGVMAEWDAELTEERANELIAWRSLEGSRIPNRGYVRFRRAPGGRGTEVSVTLTYTPPLGKLGATLAKLFGEDPGQHLDADLRRFKSLMEAGEIPTTEGQSSLWVSTRRRELAHLGQRPLAPSPRSDVVKKASEEPFPPSDAPTWALGSEEA